MSGEKGFSGRYEKGLWSILGEKGSSRCKEKEALVDMRSKGLWWMSGKEA